MAHCVARPPHEEVQPIAQKGVPKQYWETLDQGVGLSLAVHRAKVQISEKYKGELAKLEDDEWSDA
jgi:hypothetical protein